MSKRLLIFSLLYSIITIYFLNEIPKGEHGNLILIPILFIFWIVAFILLILMYRASRKRNKNKWNGVILIFCTPLPALLYLLGGYIWATNFEFKTSQKVYPKNGYIIKEVSYLYKKKKEYWSNFDSANNEYRLDSVVFYNEKENKYETEIYKDWERLKGDPQQAKLPAPK